MSVLEATNLLIALGHAPAGGALPKMLHVHFGPELATAAPGVARLKGREQSGPGFYETWELFDDVSTRSLGEFSCYDDRRRQWTISGDEIGEMAGVGFVWVDTSRMETAAPVSAPSQYPECERLAAAASNTQPAGEFVTWLRDHGYEIAEHTAAPGCGAFGLRPCMLTLDALLARWQSIDMEKVERERGQMLAEMRAERGGP